MITRNGKELSARYHGSRAVAAVYRGAALIWELISSCFGSGYWRNDQPWKNTDGWKN